jgi:hypothetical protein
MMTPPFNPNPIRKQNGELQRAAFFNDSAGYEVANTFANRAYSLQKFSLLLP